ncbi:type III PLP-dependent enzyme [Streptomyces sp. NPDC048483]|uniref:type III PLP-dependent enzyme n=1 Tax=Streptomyces sp. NPDC048483 TaxID=3154927 RepID=UPI00343DBDF8
MYVYDLDRAVAARDSLVEALPEGFEVYYALKANPHPDVARALHEGPGHGCRAEISSSGELSAALAAGFTGAECLYTGPGKIDAELNEAMERGVRIFSVESLSDARHVGLAASRHGTVADCLLRINAPAGGASTGIRMMGKPSQFGIDSETLPESMHRLTTVPGTRIVGAHFYTMSNAADEAALISEFESAIELASRLESELGLPLEFLDIGGGFAAPYAAPGARADYPRMRSELERILDRRLPRWRTGSLRLAVESGRHLVAESGCLLVRVVNIKAGRGRTFVILDAGINALGGLSGIGRLLPAAVRLDGCEQSMVATLAGPLCTPGDTLGHDVNLPELQVGDIIAIPNTGAYGVTASLLAFLGREAPCEVVLRGGEVVSVSRLDYQRTYSVMKPESL